MNKDKVEYNLEKQKVGISDLLNQTTDALQNEDYECALECISALQVNIIATVVLIDVLNGE